MFAHDLQSQILQNSEIGDLHMNYDMKKSGMRIQQLRIQHGSFTIKVQPKGSAH